MNDQIITKKQKIILFLILTCFQISCATHNYAPVDDRNILITSQKNQAHIRPSKKSVHSRHVIENKTLGSAIYNVKAGDTLYSIAWQSKLDYQEIANWNEILPPYQIFSGQKLYLVPKTKNISKINKKSATNKKPQKIKNEEIKVVKNPRKIVNNSGLSWIWPAKGSLYQAFLKHDKSKQGVDILGKLGQSIIAAAPGKVVYSGSGLISYGKLIIIKHRHHYLSAYAYNQKLLVQEGDDVKRGQQIAKMGNKEGVKSLLHFEIRYKGKPVDPIKYLPRL